MSDTRAGLRPGPSPRSVRDADGAVHAVPAGWELLPPGDAAVTRRVKALGPTWAVEEARGRKVFSRGLWAPAAHIRQASEEVAAQREDPSYQRKLEAGRRRRAEEQADYAREFEAAVLAFLRFHPRYATVARGFAARVAAHATPVGSGTVARTERIPVERRAEAAVIAWMRHQTTRYDDMQVVRIKGARRELRRELAEQSRAVLQPYRRGGEVPADCPLASALREPAVVETPPPPPRETTPPRPPVRSESARTSVPPVPPVLPRPLPARPAAAAAARPIPARAPEPPRPPAPPSAPDRDPADLLAPRNAHEEAQRALYLRVRERLTRGK